MSDQNVWTKTQDQFILDNYGRMTFAEMGRQLGGLTKNQVRGRYLRLMPRDTPTNTSHEEANAPEAEGEPKVRWQGGPNAQVVTVTGDTVRDLEGAIAAAKVDLTKWEVERWDVGKWDGFYRNRSVQHKKHDWERTAAIVELWRVKLWLKKKAGVSTDDVRKAIITEMKEYSPRYPKIARQAISGERFAYEISIPDLHVGKLAWGPEVGGEHYDTKIATALYLKAVEELLFRVRGMSIDKIVLPLGNDMLNVDNAANTTAAGTPQDVDGRRIKVVMAMKTAIVQAVEMARGVAPVHIPIVPGNHDRDTMWFLGDIIETWFRKTNDVVIDNSPMPRKYVPYGVNLIGFTHGDQEKHIDLPVIMASEVPELWAKSKHREWHLGHLHKRKVVGGVSSDTHTGVVIRTLPALCGIDAWHNRSGYVRPQRAAEAYLWGFNTGYSGHYSYNYYGEKLN